MRKKTAGPASTGICLFLFAALLLGTFSSGCRLYNLRRKLSPPDKEFLSTVRYIITSEEEKIFLELPDSEKEGFKEEFWKRRDPNPDTEENEFKTEFFSRMKEANERFLGEAKPGWLTDRGYIFLLFGPPWDKAYYSQGQTSDNSCQELWYYGNFPVIFVDAECTGQFRLTPINLEHLHELTQAEKRFSSTIQTRADGKSLFNFELSLTKKRVEGDRFEAVVLIEIPYQGLWLDSVGGKLRTTLDLSLELRDGSGDTAWEHSASFEPVLEESKAGASLKGKYVIEVPLVLESGAAGLRQGKNVLNVSLKNRTGKEELKKFLEFEINDNFDDIFRRKN